MAALSAVAVGQAVIASKTNLMITSVNNKGKRQIFTSSGNFTWPVGIDTITVWLCGGGGRCGDTWISSSVQQPSSRGGNSPLCSKAISGVDDGTTIAITIGAAGVGTGAGGTTTFGTYFQSTGGTGGHDNIKGTDGTHTGELQHDNGLFVALNDATKGPIGYGQGFPSNAGQRVLDGYAQQGGAGFCLIEY